MFFFPFNFRLVYPYLRLVRVCEFLCAIGRGGSVVPERLHYFDTTRIRSTCMRYVRIFLFFIFLVSFNRILCTANVTFTSVVIHIYINT